MINLRPIRLRFSLRNIPIDLSMPILFLLSFVFSSEAGRTKYGIDFSFVYILVVVMFYFVLYSNAIKVARYYGWWLYILLIPTILLGLFQGEDFVHLFASTLILLLPMALEPWVCSSDEGIYAGAWGVLLLSMIIVLLYANVGFLENWNTNCIGYLLYLGVGAAVVLLSNNRKNIIVWALFIYSSVQLLVTDSRNTVSALLVLILLLLLKDILKNKVIYRIAYVLSLLYPVVFPRVILRLRKTEIYGVMQNIAQGFFEKPSVLNGRDTLFIKAEELIEESVGGYLFGYGRAMSSFHSAHNDYYLLHYTYGLIGVILIAVMLIVFFEKAYELICDGDNITYGCVCVIIGVLFQQASEGWFLGERLLILMPFVYMAIVIKRYRINKKKINLSRTRNIVLY